MKLPFLLVTSIASLCISEATFAQEKKAPGKSGDAVTEPAAKPPEKTAGATKAPAERAEPGKSGDAVKEQSPNAGKEREFKGRITAVNRAEKTVTITDEKMGEHVLHVGDSTQLSASGKTANWDALKVGTTVQGKCRGTKEKAHAESITIGN